MKISIVIPCYNEKDTIEAIVLAVRAAPVQEKEIIVVDDGSSDGTIPVLKEKIAALVDKIIFHECNQGKALRSAADFKQRAVTLCSCRMRISNTIHKSIRFSSIQSSWGKLTWSMARVSWVVALIAWFTSGIWSVIDF